MDAITGATLIDGTGRPPVPDVTVVLRGGRIANVGRGADVFVPEGATVVDASGLWLLPGLIDAHAHVGPVVSGAEFPGIEDLEAFSDEFMGWYTRHGVTAVRDTGMSDTDATFRMLKEGRRGWPRFVGSGQNIDGEPGGPWPGLIAVPDAETARRAAAA